MKNKFVFAAVFVAVAMYSQAKAYCDFVLSFSPSTVSAPVNSQVTVQVLLTESATAASSRLFNQGLTSFNLNVGWSGSGTIASVSNVNNFTSAFVGGANLKGIAGNVANLGAARQVLPSVTPSIFGTQIGTNLYQASIASFTFDVGPDVGVLTNLSATAVDPGLEWTFGGNEVAGLSVSSASGSITAVPEPSSLALLGLLSVPAVAYRRWKKARA